MSIEAPVRSRKESLDSPQFTTKIFEGMKKRITQIEIVRRAVESLSSDESPEQNIARLELAKQSFLDEFPIEQSEQAKALFTVLRRSDPGLFHRMYSFEKREDGEESDHTHMDRFFRDPVMNYALNILSTIEKKKQFVWMIAGWKKNPSSLFPYLRDQLEIEIKKSDIKSVEFSGCTANVVVTGEFVANYGRKSHKVFENDAAGLYYANSPICLISSEERAYMKNVVEHEQTHAFLEGALVSLPSPASALTGKLAEIDARDEAQQEKEARKVHTFECVRVPEVINGCKEELLAELRQTERLQFRAKETEVVGEDSLFERAVAITATAGGWMEKMEWTLRSHDQEQKATALKSAYVAVIQEMESALGCARLIGPEAVSEVHALLLLLEPTQFKYISAFLEKKYPDFDVKGARIAIQLNANLHPDPIGIHRAFLLLESSRPMLREAFDEELYESSREALDDRIDNRYGRDEYYEYYEELFSGFSSKETLSYILESYTVESRMQLLFPKLDFLLLEWARDHLLCFEAEPKVLLEELATRPIAERELFKKYVTDYFCACARLDELSWREYVEDQVDSDIFQYVSALGIEAELERLCP